MSFTFNDLQNEVKRRATLNQSGTSFDTAVKNTINTSLLRIARDGLWRALRRKTTFDTVGTYTTGSGGGTFTNGSKSVTMTGATFLTDGIKIGQRITLQGDSTVFTIKTITGETTLTIDQNYGGTTISGTGTYSILGQEEYNLPIQTSHKVFLWHEAYGSPWPLIYVPSHEYYETGVSNTTENIPTHYRMWGEDMIQNQVLEASVVSVSSSDSDDTSKDIVVFGIVSGVPDSETITTNASNGTTAVAGSKSFSSVERIVKSASTDGRITATANSGNVTLVTLPPGDISAGIQYRKVQLHPLPDTVYPINVYYYKEVARLVNDNDVHELGADFDEAIILLTTAKLKGEQNQKEGDKFFGLWKDEMKSLKRTNVDKIDWFPMLKRPGQSLTDPLIHPHLRASQFGAKFGTRV